MADSPCSDSSQLVLPGQTISSESHLPSHNTYTMNNLVSSTDQLICSSVLGHPEIINKLIMVRPASYTMKYYSGQLVLARVNKLMAERVRVSLGTCEGTIQMESLRNKGNIRSNWDNCFRSSKTPVILNNQFSNSNENQSKSTSDSCIKENHGRCTGVLGNESLKNSINTNIPNSNSFDTFFNPFSLQRGTLILAQIQKTTGKTMTLTANAQNYGILEEGVVLDIPYSYISHEMNNLMSIGKRLYTRDNVLVCAIPTNHMIYIHRSCAKELIRYFRNRFTAKQPVIADEIEKIINKI